MNVKNSVGPVWVRAHDVPLGTEGKKFVLRKLTLHESNKTSSFEFLCYTKCLSCLSQTQRVGPARIRNAGKRERNSLSHETLNKMEFVFVAFQTSDSQCKVEMVKRFGEGVTMQDIESFAVNRTLEEMKEHARKKEISLFKKIKSADVSLFFY